MYDTSRFLRWLCRWLFICTCAGSTVSGAAFSGYLSNASPATAYATVCVDGTWKTHSTLTTGSRVYFFSGYSGSSAQVVWSTTSLPACGDGSCQATTYTAAWTMDVFNSCGSPTTNTCSASVYLVNTTGTSFGQHWRVQWVYSTGSIPIWDGYLEPNGNLTLNVSYDQGSGYCPGDLIAVGDRPGYDTPTNIVSSSTNGTRNLTDPGNQTDQSGNTGNKDTNSLSKGDLTTLLGELRGIAKERTQQGATNIQATINTSIVAGNAHLSAINGKLQTVTNQLAGIATQLAGVAQESTLRTATNQLAGIDEKMRQTTNLLSQATNNLAGIRGALNMTNYDDHQSRAAPFIQGATNAANAAADAIAADPWTPKSFGSANFSNSPALRGLHAMVGSIGENNASTSTWAVANIPTTVTATDPEPNNAWLTWEQPSITVPALGAAIAGYTWNWTPTMPTNPVASAAITAVINLIYLVWCVAISFALWWDIRRDSQEQLLKLWGNPQATGAGLSVAGTRIPVVGEIAAAAIICGIIYTAGAHLTGWITNSYVTGSWNYTWNNVKTALESGTIGGYFSIWIPRITSWVSMAFPFSLAFGAIAMEIAYYLSRDWVLRVASAAIKAVAPFIAVAFLLWLPASANATTMTLCSPRGSVTLSVDNTNASVTLAGVTMPIGAGYWRLPVAGLTALTANGVSNALPELIDGASIFLDQTGNLAMATPDTLDRENTLLMWGTAGLVTGCFFGYLSLTGFILKRGLFPHTRSWGGES